MPLETWEVESPELALLLCDVKELIEQVEIKMSATLEKQHAAKTRALEQAHEAEVRDLEAQLETSKTQRDACKTSHQARLELNKLEYEFSQNSAAHDLENMQAKVEALQSSHRAEIKEKEIQYKTLQAKAVSDVDKLQAEMKALKSSHRAEIKEKETQYKTLLRDMDKTQTKTRALETSHQAEIDRKEMQYKTLQTKAASDMDKMQAKMKALETSHEAELERMKQQRRSREEQLQADLERSESRYKDRLDACEKRGNARLEECKRQRKARNQAEIERMKQEQRHREEEIETKLKLCEMQYKDQLLACETRGSARLEECERQWKNSSTRVEDALKEMHRLETDALATLLLAAKEELKQLKGLRTEQSRTKRRPSELRTKISKLDAIAEVNEEHQAENPDPEESHKVVMEHNNIDVSNEPIGIPKAEEPVSKESISVEVEQNNTKAELETPHDGGQKQPTFETSDAVREDTEVADIDETPETQSAEAKKQGSSKSEEKKEQEKLGRDNTPITDTSEENNRESTSKTKQTKDKGEQITGEHVDRCDYCTRPFGDERKQWLSWSLCGHCYSGFTVQLSVHYTQWAKDVQAMRESRGLVAFPYVPAGSARCYQHECKYLKQQRDGLRACIHDFQFLLRSSPEYRAKSREGRIKWLKTQCRQWHPDQFNKMFGRWEKQDGTDLGDKAQSWDRNFTAMFTIFSALVELEAGSNQQQSTGPSMATATEQGFECHPQ